VARLTHPEKTELKALAEGRLDPDTTSTLMAHLAACDICKMVTFPAAVADTLPTAGGAAPSPNNLTVTEEAPGRYELLRVLGRGGQAVVHVAFDHHLGREVAMKLPHLNPAASSSAQEQTALRFLREARITARLEHPNIVPIHEIGRRADGSYYCTQRLIRPSASATTVRTLRTALAEAKTLEERIALLPHFVAICNAVAHAHSRGVLHRDLKPDNVVIGALGETVVLDWGLARLRGESADLGSQDGVVSIAGHAMGTPSYMSPEQARGDPSTDERSDVWSLGAILYELLTGQPPFIGGNVMEVVARVQSQPVTSVLSVSVAAPRALAAVAMRALERDVRQRYDSAQVVGQEVAAWLADLPVRAYRYSLFEQVRLLVARNKTAAAVVMIAFALLAASAVLVLRENQNKSLALADVLLGKAREAEDNLQWDRAAAYYAAARVQVDREDTRYGVMLAGNRAALRVRRFTGHVGTVKALARSPDGRTLASGGFDRTVRLWNVESGKTTRLLEGHQNVVTAVAFSPDGRWLASASEDNTVRLWDLKADTMGEVIVTSESALNAVAFNPGSSALAVGGEDGKIYRVAMADRSISSGGLPGGGPDSDPAQKSGPVYGVTFSPDGTQIVSGSWDQQTRFWSADGGFELRRTVKDHTDSVLAVQYSPDGQLLATASRDGTVLLYAAGSSQLAARLTGHTQKVYGIDFSPDSQLIAAGSPDKSVRLWLTTQSPKLYGGANWRALIGASYARDHQVTSVVFLDGSTLAWAGGDGDIFVRTVEVTLPGDTDFYPTDSLVLLSSKQELLYSIGAGFRRHRLSDFAPLPTVPVPDTIVHYGYMGVSASPDETLLAAGCKAPNLCWIDLKNPMGSGATVVEGAIQITSTSFSPDGHWLAAGTRQGAVVLFDPRTRLEVTRLTEHTQGTFSVAFSPDGKLLAAASYDKTIRLWDTTSWKPVRILRGHEHGVRRLVFSPDGKLLASASWDRDARLWDVATGTSLAVLKGHQDQLYAIAFSPDGTLLATGGWDGVIRVWNVKTHQQLARYVSNETRLWSLAFSLDSKSLYYGGLWQPTRLDFKLLASPGEALAQSLKAGGFRLEGADLVRDSPTEPW
jgi:eukaryotic-like serine/threonine-protein kinase